MNTEMSPLRIRDDLTRIELDAEKAATALAEVIESYFIFADPEKETHALVADYARCGIVANIALDYLLIVENQVDELKKKLDEHRKAGQQDARNEAV